METQNISGADIISSGFNINPKVSSENVKQEKQEVHEEINAVDKGKGNIIDIKA